MIEAARAMLRAQPRAEITRKSVAAAARITPALVSYYFPEQFDLFYAAIDPVIRRYIDRFYAIVGVDGGSMEGLGSLIELFLDVNRGEARLLDNYLTIIRDDPNGNDRRAEIERAQAALVDFMDRLIEREGWRGVRGSWLTLALWGICRSIAEAPMLPVGLYGADLTGTGLERQQIEDVLAFVKGGARSCCPL